MPLIEIGPYEGTIGPDAAKTEVLFLRIAQFSSAAQIIPPGKTDRATLIETIGLLLKAQESKLSDLMLAFRLGEVGIEEDATGRVTKVTFSYPELTENQGDLPS